MKKLIVFIALLIPVAAIAENFQGMNKQQLQAMMQQAQQMQSCMKNIDQSELQAFEQRGRAMESEIKALCSAGNQSEALSKAIMFSKEVAASSVIQELKNCGDMVQGMLSNLPKIMQSYENDKNDSKRNICDAMK